MLDQSGSEDDAENAGEHSDAIRRREREWRSDSHFAAAVDSMINYVNGALSLVRLTHQGLTQITTEPELFRILDFSDERVADAEETAAKAHEEIAAGYPTLHAHSLLGLWGALESFVEDLFMATLRTNPAILQGEAFGKVKLPVSLMLGEDDSERLRAILTELSRSTGSDLAQGVTKFERLLEPVGLAGMTPARVRDAIYDAQQIRNVWAHRGGTADARFVKRCPHLGFQLGNRVNMDVDLFMHLFHGMNLYGLVLINRHLDKRGLARANLEFEGFEGVLGEVPAPSPG